MPLIGKYRLPGNHEPRCNCSDCNAMFLEHNRRLKSCTCGDCTAHREVNAPAPRTTTPEEMELAYAQRQRAYRTPTYNPPKRQGKIMGNLNICDRPGCNAIIKGVAVAYLDIVIHVDAEHDAKTLCPACIAEIDAMLHMPPATERQRSYDKPYTGYKDPETSDTLNTMSTEQLAAELFQRTMREAQKTLESGK